MPSSNQIFKKNDKKRKELKVETFTHCSYFPIAQATRSDFDHNQEPKKHKSYEMLPYKQNVYCFFSSKRYITDQTPDNPRDTMACSCTKETERKNYKKSREGNAR